MEMIARGERERLRNRFKAMVILSASLGGVAAVMFVLCNSVFVSVWTAGKIAWPAGYDLLLAVWMVILVLQHCHCSFVITTKRIGSMRYIYFIEGVVFTVIAFLIARAGGLGAIILTSIVCATCFSFAYGLRHTARYFSFTQREVVVGWQLPMLKVLMTLGPLALLLWLACRALPGPARLALEFVIAGVFGIFFFLRFGVSPDLREELVQRAPQRLTRILDRIWGNRSPNRL